MKKTDELILPKAILLDLDGTLVDSAPDLAAAINKVRSDRQLPKTPYELLRPVASAGAQGLIRVAFGIGSDHEDYPDLVEAFLLNYASAIAVKTTLFDGIPELLDLLRTKNIPWGVVTNKRHYLTVPLLQEIGLHDAACVISGDTTPHPKPHPEPVLEAARRIGVEPHECWYIGDDVRDVISGNAAGSVTIAVNWGYGEDTLTWGADLVVDTPWQILDLIAKM